jgi:hypothetical protein
MALFTAGEDNDLIQLSVRVPADSDNLVTPIIEQAERE